MKSISTKGGVGGGVLLLRKGCETDYHYAGRGWEVVIIGNTVS